MNLIGVAVDRPRGRMILAIVPLGLLVKMRKLGYCAKREKWRSCDASMCSDGGLVMRPCAVKNVKRIWTLVLGTKSILDPSPGNEIHRELLFLWDY